MPSFIDSPALSETDKTQVGTTDDWNRYVVDNLISIYDKSQAFTTEKQRVSNAAKALATSKITLPNDWQAGQLLTVNGAGQYARAWAEAHTVLHPNNAYFDRGYKTQRNGITVFSGRVNDSRVEAYFQVVPPKGWIGGLRAQFSWKAGRLGTDRSRYSRTTATVHLRAAPRVEESGSNAVTLLSSPARTFALSTITQPEPYTTDWVVEVINAVVDLGISRTGWSVPISQKMNIYIYTRGGNLDGYDTYPVITPVLLTWQVET